MLYSRIILQLQRKSGRQWHNMLRINMAKLKVSDSSSMTSIRSRIKPMDILLNSRRLIVLSSNALNKGGSTKSPPFHMIVLEIVEQKGNLIAKEKSRYLHFTDSIEGRYIFCRMRIMQIMPILQLSSVILSILAIVNLEFL
jgi:hypothetical protein